jgi:hypothetical protein
LARPFRNPKGSVELAKCRGKAKEEVEEKAPVSNTEAQQIFDIFKLYFATIEPFFDDQVLSFTGFLGFRLDLCLLWRDDLQNSVVFAKSFLPSVFEDEDLGACLQKLDLVGYQDHDF